MIKITRIFETVKTPNSMLVPNFDRKHINRCLPMCSENMVKRCQKCCHMSSILTLLHEIVAAE